jgi:hypothetical protein
MGNQFVDNLGSIADLLSPLWVYRDGLSLLAGFIVFIIWDWWQTQQLNAADSPPPPSTPSAQQKRGMWIEKGRH